MAVAWSDVVNVAPQLAAVPTAAQTAFLTIANLQVDPEVWGALADTGVTYLAAHLAAIRFNTGFLTSESVGPLSRGYAAPLIASRLSSSIYGQEYDRLLRIAVAVPAFVP